MISLVVNGESVEMSVTTVEELTSQLAIPRRGVAVALNGEVVPRSLWATQTVSEGDRVEVVTAAAGG